MRGSPLLRALLAFAAIALLGWPLWRLTHSGAVARSVEAAPPSQITRVQMELTFTVPPEKVTVAHLGRALFTAEAPAASLEREVQLPWPKEGVDLHFTISWPAGAPLAAARVRVTDPDGREHDKTIWSTGPADEVLTFP